MAFTLKPAVSRNFVGRNELLEELVSSLSGKLPRAGFALYGRRRVGKTSVMLEVKRRLEKGGRVVPVYFSVWNLVNYSVEEFSRKLSIEMLNAYAPRLSLKYRARALAESPLHVLSEFLKELKVSVGLREDISFILTFEREKKTSPDQLLERLFGLSEKLAKETRAPCILMIDEFPSIMELKNGSRLGEPIIRKIRSVYEGLDNVELVISGSIRSTMETAALSSNSAFYRQLVAKEVRPLEEEYAAALFTRNFAGKVSAKGLEELYRATQGVPFYIQFIGRTIETMHLREVGAKEVKAALERFLSEEGTLLFREEFGKMSPKEREIIVDMAVAGNSRITGIARSIGETPASVSQFLSYLEEKGYVEKRDSAYFNPDPVFSLWLGKRYG